MLLNRLILLSGSLGISSGYKEHDVIDNHIRIPGRTYYPSVTGDFFYSEIRNHMTSGIYYVDVRIGDEYKEYDLLLSAREPHLGLISVGCDGNMCRVPTKYDPVDSSGATTYPDEFIREETVDFYDTSSRLFETRLSGSMVGDVIVFGTDDDNYKDTPVDQKVFAVSQSTNTFLIEQDGYIGFAPYTG